MYSFKLTTSIIFVSSFLILQIFCATTTTFLSSPVKKNRRYGKIIDIHHHNYLSDQSQADWNKTSGGRLGPAPRNATDHLIWMESVGVRTCILTASQRDLQNLSDPLYPATLLNDTRSVHDIVVQYPLRFGYFGALPTPLLNKSLEAIDIMQTWPIRPDGYVLITSRGGIYPGDPSLAPLWQRLNQLNATVFVHPQTPITWPKLSPTLTTFSPAYYEWMFDTTRALYNLFISGGFNYYRNIKWIFAHTGGTFPFLAGRLSRHLIPDTPDNGIGLLPAAAAVILGNRTYEEIISSLWFDTTISNVGHFYELRDMGANPAHLLSGSDFPWYRYVSDAGEQSGLLDDRGINGVRYRNALELFPRLKQLYIQRGIIQPDDDSFIGDGDGDDE